MFDRFKEIVNLEYASDNSFGKPGVVRRLVNEPDSLSIIFDDGVTATVCRASPELTVKAYVSQLVDQVLPVEEEVT